MKKNIETGAKVINFLASCGRTDVEMEDLLAAVVDGFKAGDDVGEAYSMVRDTLKELAGGGMVSLSAGTVSPDSPVPCRIHIRPMMSKAAAALMHGENAGDGDGSAAGNGKKDKGRGKKGRSGTKNAVESRFYTILDLMDKKGKRVRLGGEWNRLIASIIYQDIERETGLQACVDAFVNGLVWQVRREEADGGSSAAPVEEKAGMKIRPELLGQIDAILKADEDKNGELKGRKTRHRRREDDASLTKLDRDEMRDFIRCLNRIRADIHPGKLWQQAMSMFFNRLLENMPVYEACRESFRAGIVFQMHRKRLEA